MVWKSPHVKNTVTPHWPYVRINMMPLCNNDLDRELLIELFDYNSSGQVTCSLQFTVDRRYYVIDLWGILLYTSGVLFHVEWCIRQLSCSSIISCNITSIAHNHYTNIYSNTYIHTCIHTYNLYIYLCVCVRSTRPWVRLS